MDRDEAIARGLRVHETQHSMKRRSPWHDYHGRGTYMLTLVVEGRMPLLGKLWGRVDARPGDGDAPKVMLSELGIAIAKEEIPKIHKYYPQVEVWRVCIMPDHIHLIVRVKEDLRGGQAMESLGTEARGGQASALAKGANETNEVAGEGFQKELFHFVHPALDEDEGWKVHKEVERLVKQFDVQEICKRLNILKKEGKVLLPQNTKNAHEELIRMGMPIEKGGFGYKTFCKYYNKD